MTPSIVQTLHLFANLLPNWTLIPILTLLPNFGGFHGTLQRVRLANRGRLLLRTPGPVPFGTCICSNVETILSWTCHVYGPFEFRTSLGTSILLCNAYKREDFSLFATSLSKAKLMQSLSLFGCACIIPRATRLSNKIFEQGYVLESLKLSLRKFYGRYGDLIKQYEVSLSRMLKGIV